MQEKTILKLQYAISAENECIKNLKAVIRNHKSTVSTLEKVLKTANKLDDRKANKKARVSKEPTIMPTKNDESEPITNDEKEKTATLVQDDVEEKVPETSPEEHADEKITPVEDSLLLKKKKKVPSTKKESEPTLNENTLIATDGKLEGSLPSKKKGKVGASKPKTEEKQGETYALTQQ